MVVDIRIPPTRTTEGLDTARVITRSCPTSASWCSPRTSKSAMRWQIGSRGLATSQSVYCPPPHGRPQTEARLPASVHRGRSGRRPPPRHVDPVGRVLPDPDARHTDLGSDLPRAGHPRQPRHRPPRSGQSRLRPPRPIRRGPRATPGRFQTRVITAGVTPSLHVDDNPPRSSSKGRPRGPRPPSPTPTIFGIGNDHPCPAHRAAAVSAPTQPALSRQQRSPPIDSLKCDLHRLRPRPHHSHPTHTRPRSTTSPAQQVSPHDTINPTPAHQTLLKTRLRRF